MALIVKTIRFIPIGMKESANDFAVDPFLVKMDDINIKGSIARNDDAMVEDVFT